MAKLTRDQVRELAELREQGWSYQRLADRYGVTPTAIHYRCLVEGARSPRAHRPRYTDRPQRGFGGVVRRFTPIEDARIIALRRGGATIATVAADLGRAPTSVRIRLLTLELWEDADVA